MSFAEGYVDVATRIATFRAKYPEGSLRPYNPLEPITIITIADKTYLQYVACAYRTADDLTPGIGVAWEPFPGRTPYTRDSEAMVAETSAWGRAIVASLAADTHSGVASAEEIRNRRNTDAEPPPLAAAKARAWRALKALKPDEDDETRTEFTKAALEARGSTIADADVGMWNMLGADWEAQVST